MKGAVWPVVCVSTWCQRPCFVVSPDILCRVGLGKYQAELRSESAKEACFRRTGICGEGLVGIRGEWTCGTCGCWRLWSAIVSGWEACLCL